VLKVPHHGSATSSTATFIAAVHPEAAVISDGYLNHFHFPAPAVVNRYADAGVKLLRTDVDGAVAHRRDSSSHDDSDSRCSLAPEPKPDSSAGLLIVMRMRRSPLAAADPSLRQLRITFSECTDSTASSGTVKSPAFST